MFKTFDLRKFAVAVSFAIAFFAMAGLPVCAQDRTGSVVAPQNLPDYIKIYPGAVLTFAGPGLHGFSKIKYTVSAPVSDVIDFYIRNGKAKGILCLPCMEKPATPSDPAKPSEPKVRDSAIFSGYGTAMLFMVEAWRAQDKTSVSVIFKVRGPRQSGRDI